MADDGQQPQAQLSSDDFATKIKAQYPQYAHLDNAVLTQKMLEKYPVYRDKVAPALPKNTAGQTVYPQPKIGGGGPPSGVTDPIPDAARGIMSGFRGQETPTNADMPERVGHFIGKEGPAIAGMGAAAVATGGAAIAPALGAAALGGGAGEAYRQLFGRAIGGKELSSMEAGHLIGAQMIKQAAAEIGGRATTKTFQIIKGMLPESLNALASMPAEYVKRAMARPDTALPRVGETLATTEAAAMKHLTSLQEAVERGRAEAGQGVDKALEALHVKTGGRKVADTKPLADAMRKIIDEKYRAADPTVQTLAKTDLQRIAKVLRTLEPSVSDVKETAEQAALRKASGVMKPDAGAMKNVTLPMKSIKDLVQIRRELDNMVGYTPAGVPKMESDMGAQFSKALAGQFRELIAKTAEGHGDKDLLLANAKFQNMARNYEEWQPVLTTRTEGDTHLMSRVEALYNYVGKGGARSESLKTLKEAFPGAARSVDALHDTLARRAFIMSPEKSNEILKPLIRSILGPGGTGAAAIRGASSVANSSIPPNAARAASQALPAGVIEALLAHIKPEDRKK